MSGKVSFFPTAWYPTSPINYVQVGKIPNQPYLDWQCQWAVSQWAVEKLPSLVWQHRPTLNCDFRMQTWSECLEMRWQNSNHLIYFYSFRLYVTGAPGPTTGLMGVNLPLKTLTPPFALILSTVLLDWTLETGLSSHLIHGWIWR